MPCSRLAAPLRAERFVPGFFVLIWSTGFIFSKLGLPYAGPLSFLALRFVLVVALMAPLAWVAGAAWPGRPILVLHVAIAGLLLQGGYLGGVFVAISKGVAPSVAALIVGLQPLLTAALAGLVLNERVRAIQWLGLGLGCLGVAMVVANPAMLDLGRLAGAGFAAIAMLSITAGTLYQKRFCGAVDLRATLVIQNLAAGAVMLPLALWFEGFEIRWSPAFALALFWLVTVLSVGASLLLFRLIRRGAAAKVASLFYLTPAVTAVASFVIFGDSLSPLAVAGMAVTGCGVLLANA
jgi:drug/metabolite transporter (DMT)-like permease